MEEKTNLHNGAIDHCHNKQPAVAWREYVFRRRSPGERVFVDTRLLRIWWGLVSVRKIHSWWHFGDGFAQNQIKNVSPSALGTWDCCFFPAGWEYSVSHPAVSYLFSPVHHSFLVEWGMQSSPSIVIVCCWQNPVSRFWKYFNFYSFHTSLYTLTRCFICCCCCLLVLALREQCWIVVWAAPSPFPGSFMGLSWFLHHWVWSWLLISLSLHPDFLYSTYHSL